MNQATLNAEMKQQGKARYWRRVAEANEKQRESSASHGNRLLSGAIPHFSNAIKEWRKEIEQRGKGAIHSNEVYRLLAPLPSDTISFIAARGLIDSISLKKLYSRSCVQVASLVEDEARFQYLKKNAPHLFKKVAGQVKEMSSYEKKRLVIVLTMNRVEKKDGGYFKIKGDDEKELTAAPFERWTESQKVKIGSVLTDLFRVSTGLIELTTVQTSYRPFKQKTYITATASTLEWIEKFHRHSEQLTPIWLPMVDPPAIWKTPWGGGYDADEFNSCFLVKRGGKDYLECLSQLDIHEIYESVNLLQETSWKVNAQTLDVMFHFWDKSIPIGGLPNREDEPTPTKPIDINTNEEARKLWRKKAAKTIKLNLKTKSKRLQTSEIISLALKFKDTKQFYFPYQLDFRGRTYCVSNYLQPQGTDFSKSLLLFNESKPIQDKTDSDWLALYGANLFGYDKVAFDSRVQWTEDHRQEILDTAKDPIQSCDWWSQADEPWQFLSWCLEWSGFLEKGHGFQTRFPVCLDGSNNGLQILSLLTRDEVCGRATNCIDGDTPADIYQDVADAVNTLLRAESEEGQKTAAMANFWLNFGVDRKACKRPVMVLPYGGTAFSRVDYLHDWFEELWRERGKEPLDDKQSFQLCAYLGQKVWEGIEMSVGRPLKAMEWLQDCARIMTEHKLPIEWTAPTGFLIRQHYKDSKRQCVKTTLGDKIHSLYIRNEIEGSLNSSKQINGVSPNFVHSLDAAALHKTMALTSNFGIQSFAMVHDSYGVLAPDVDVMAACLRKAYADIFEEDWLARFREELLQQLPTGTKLPEPPEYGSMNPRDVESSKFFFA